MLSSKSVYLSVDKEDARSRIIESVENIRSSQNNDRITIRSPTGINLAILSDYDLPDGTHGSKLEYRTGPMIPHGIAPAVTKAKRIRGAVAKYERA